MEEDEDQNITIFRLSNWRYYPLWCMVQQCSVFGFYNPLSKKLTNHLTTLILTCSSDIRCVYIFSTSHIFYWCGFILGYHNQECMIIHWACWMKPINLKFSNKAQCLHLHVSKHQDLVTKEDQSNLYLKQESKFFLL